jgi:hypothetical protein
MRQDSAQTAFPRLTISSWDELRRSESEIVRRVNSFPHGPRLLLIDPQRLLKDLGVLLQPGVIDEWQRITSENLFAPTGLERTYDAVSQANPSSGPSLKLNALIDRKGLRACSVATTSCSSLIVEHSFNCCNRTCN